MSSFDPNPHLRTLKGQSYLDVKWRVKWFRMDHPDGQIGTELLHVTDSWAVFKAVVAIPGGATAAAHGSETKADFGDFLEKAETKAIGRALALLGFGTQFAPEFDEADRIVDSPVSKPNGVVSRQAPGYVKAFPPANAATSAVHAKEFEADRALPDDPDTIPPFDLKGDPRAQFNTLAALADELGIGYLKPTTLKETPKAYAVLRQLVLEEEATRAQQAQLIAQEATY